MFRRILVIILLTLSISSCSSSGGKSTVDCGLDVILSEGYERIDLSVEPISEYRGSGDTLLNIQKGIGEVLVHIVGNSARKDFDVIARDSNKKAIDLLVRTTNPYDGIRKMDVYEGEHTALLDITATGEWEVKIYPFYAIYIAVAPERVDGVGDNILHIEGGPFNIRICGIVESGEIGVFAHYSDYSDLLVSSSKSIDETFEVFPDIIFLEILTTERWSIELIK